MARGGRARSRGAPFRLPAFLAVLAFPAVAVAEQVVGRPRPVFYLISWTALLAMGGLAYRMAVRSLPMALTLLALGIYWAVYILVRALSGGAAAELGAGYLAIAIGAALMLPLAASLGLWRGRAARRKSARPTDEAPPPPPD